MRKFILRYLLPRIGQYFMVIFLGVTLTFIIPRLSPNDPVERQISQIMMSGSQVSPEAIIHLREALDRDVWAGRQPFAAVPCFLGPPAAR